MLKFPCLVLDHDDTVVQSEYSINYPYFCYILDQFRPGATITWEQYTQGCFQLGFADMCRQWYQFTEDELKQEYLGWKNYIRNHIPLPFPGIVDVIRRFKEADGIVCVVSHSSSENISRDYLTHVGFLPDDIFGWDLPEQKRKPSTYSLETIMEKYGFTPDQLLVLDDMKPAYDMARAAGVPIAFAAWGRMEQPQIRDFMESSCDYTFYEPEQLANFLFI